MSPSSILINAGIFVISLFFSLLPGFFKSFPTLKRVLPQASVFAAGIQLSSLLVDLLPHLASNEHSGEGSKHTDHSSHSHAHGDHKEHSHEHEHHHDKAHGHHDGHSHGDLKPFILSGAVFILLLGIDSLVSKRTSKKESTSSSKPSHHSHNSHTENGEHHHDHHSSHDHHHSHESHAQHENETGGCCNTSEISHADGIFKALVLLLGISAHSFLEGLSVKISNLLTPLVIGIVLHKIIESFSVGMAVFSSQLALSKKFFLLLFYSALTPLGILIASYTETVSGNKYSKWFDSLSFGALLFVVCVESISHSFAKGKNIERNLFFLFSGYLIGCMIVLVAHG